MKKYRYNRQSDNVMKIKNGEGLIVGGEVKKSGGRLAVKIVGLSEVNNRQAFLKTEGNIIIIGGAEIKIDNSNDHNYPMRFTSAGLITAEKEGITYRIEVHPVEARSANRVTLRKEFKIRKKIQSSISDLYKEESDEIDVFAKITDEMLKK